MKYSTVNTSLNIEVANHKNLEFLEENKFPDAVILMELCTR